MRFENDRWFVESYRARRLEARPRLACFVKGDSVALLPRPRLLKTPLVVAITQARKDAAFHYPDDGRPPAAVSAPPSSRRF